MKKNQKYSGDGSCHDICGNGGSGSGAGGCDVECNK